MNKNDIFMINIDKPIEPVLTEDVFYADKEGMGTIIDAFAKIKEAYKEFKRTWGPGDFQNPFENKKFASDVTWKNLEHALQKKFNLHNVLIIHMFEYSAGSYPMNTYTYAENRYPIEGLISPKGFYDKTRSLSLEVYMSLSLLDTLTPEELTAVLLHEFGHNIDPKLTDIQYYGASKFIEYLGDKKLNNRDEIKAKVREMNKLFGADTALTINAILYLLYIITAAVISLWRVFRTLFFNPEKALIKIKEAIKKDKDQFDIYNNTEAFADNFVRMYGMGHYLISGLDKIDRAYYKVRNNSYFLKYKERDRILFDFTISCIKDEHKTNAHRLYNMIKEYEKDLADPNIPEGVKKGIREDKKQLEDMIDEFMNNKETFMDKMNIIIIETLYDEKWGELKINKSKNGDK